MRSFFFCFCFHFFVCLCVCVCVCVCMFVLGFVQCSHVWYERNVWFLKQKQKQKPKNVWDRFKIYDTIINFICNKYYTYDIYVVYVDWLWNWYSFSLLFCVYLCVCVHVCVFSNIVWGWNIWRITVFLFSLPQIMFDQKNKFCKIWMIALFLSLFCVFMFVFVFVFVFVCEK